ncbi:MAG: fasciclin domain-containing protein [Marinifilaceae bacterium]
MKKYITYTILFSLLSFLGCESASSDESFAKEEGMTIGDYLESNRDFSLWTSLLKSAKLFDALTVRNTFTCFVPTNATVDAYAKELNLASLDEMKPADLIHLLKYHVIEGTQYQRIQMKNGKLADTTASGDYLISKYSGDLNVVINDRASLVGTEIKTSNGLIHIVDKCLDPITESVKDIVATESRYSLFNELVQITGVDTAYMQNIYNALGNKYYVTLFVVSNDVFKSEEIESVEDLIERFSPHRDDYTNKQNPLNKYAAYHLISGMQSFSDLADFEQGPRVKNIATLAKGELITVQDNGTFSINYDEESDQPILTFGKTNYNIMARNGMIHEVTGIMPIYSPKPVSFKLELTDGSYFPEFTGLEWYRKGSSSGQGKTNNLTMEAFPFIRYETIPENTGRIWYETRSTWTGGYFDNADVLAANCGPVGWWEMDLPAIIKGKYKVKMQIHKAVSRGVWQLSVNGVKVGAPIQFVGTGYTKTTVDVGVVNLRETGAPTIRFTVVSAGQMEVDYIIFEPVN